MAYITNYEYYSNSGVSPTNENHGSYQYLSMVDIVRNFKSMYVGPDKILDNVPTRDIRFKAKECFRFLNYDATREIRAAEIDVGSDLKVILPHDYIDYIRLSVLVDGSLFTLHENHEAMTAKAYLLDNNGDLQFDNDGVVLYETDSELDTSRKESGDSNDIDEYIDGTCTRYHVGGHYYLDPGKASSTPTFSVEKRSGIINFSSDMSGKKLILEYISDGMEAGIDSAIMVNKLFEKYMYAYIANELLSIKINTPVMVRRSWDKRMKAERANARIRVGKLSPSDIIMTMRGKNKWIK